MKSEPGPPMTLGNAATARVRLIVNFEAAASSWFLRAGNDRSARPAAGRSNMVIAGLVGRARSILRSCET
jgi:hypothetical protein